MARIQVIDTPKHIGEEVIVKGWIRARRDHGKLIFIDLRDGSGLLQIVFNQKVSQKAYDAATELKNEYVVSITGKVNKRPENLINPKLKTGTVEVEATGLEVLSQAETPPFDMGGDVLNVELPTLLDNRSLTLRHPKIASIFAVQAALVEGFRNAAEKLGAIEIVVPTIVASSTKEEQNFFLLITTTKKHFFHKAHSSINKCWYRFLKEFGQSLMHIGQSLQLQQGILPKQHKWIWN